MSEPLVEKTIELKFNNGDFERKVESSINSIEKLKSSLDFRYTEKSFESFAHTLNSINLDGLKGSVGSLNKSFSSLLENIGNIYLIKKGIQAFESLEGAVSSTVKEMVGISSIKSGWEKYETKTKSVQTIMNATGKSINEVTKALNKLSWYSDETSYDFADMVNNIGKFTSNGIALEDAVSAMEGISNWAAASGQGKSEASRVMYNLSQAIGLGSVKMQDWKSVEMAFMGTKEFKQTVIDTGVAMGKLKKVGDEFYTTAGKKQKVTFENFSSTLSTGWFTSDLLIKTLKKYSDYTDKVYEYIQTQAKLHPEKGVLTFKEAVTEMGHETDEFGYKVVKAAQEAKTFKDAVDAIKDATSSGWMQTFELIFGNYEQSRKLWSDLADDMYDTFAEPENERNAFLTEVLTTNYGKLKKAIDEAGLSVDEFEKKLYDSITGDEKKRIDELIAEYGNFGRVLEVGEVEIGFIQKAFESLGANNKEGKKTIKTLDEIQQIVKDTWTTDKYGTGSERFEKYTKLGYDPVAMQKLVTLFTKKGKIEMEDLAAVGIEASETYSESWSSFVEGNKELIDSLDELSGRELIVGSLSNILSVMFHTINSIRDTISSIFGLNPEKVIDALKNVYEFTDKYSEKFKELITAIITPFKSIVVIGKQFATKLFGDSLSNLASNMSKRFDKMFMTIYTWHRRVAKLFTSLETSKSGKHYRSSDAFY